MKEVFMYKDQREIQRKIRILRHAEETGHCELLRIFDNPNETQIYDILQLLPKQDIKRTWSNSSP